VYTYVKSEVKGGTFGVEI